MRRPPLVPELDYQLVDTSSVEALPEAAACLRLARESRDMPIVSVAALAVRFKHRVQVILAAVAPNCRRNRAGRAVAEATAATGLPARPPALDLGCHPSSSEAARLATRRYFGEDTSIAFGGHRTSGDHQH
jgi:hypothetical protein